MFSQDNKTLEFDQYQQSHQAPFIIYKDLQCNIEKINGCKINPENSSITKESEHISSGFLTSMVSSFKRIGNKHDLYKGKDCMGKAFESLREHLMKIISFKKKKESY